MPFELNANGNFLTFCDHVSYGDSKTVRRKAFSCLLQFFSNPFDHGAYVVCVQNYTLYVRQNGANLALMYSFPLSVTKILAIPNLTIQ